MKNRVVLVAITLGVLVVILGFALAGTLSNPAFQKAQSPAGQVKQPLMDVKMEASAVGTIAKVTFIDPTGQTIKTLDSFSQNNSTVGRALLRIGETVTVRVLAANTEINDEKGLVKCSISIIQKDDSPDPIQLSTNSAEGSDLRDLFPAPEAICTYTFRG